jgi:peptidoglycan L-alanyl-D-glutamate endopeptidase CwlK
MTNYKWSSKSLSQLKTVDDKLILLFNEVLKVSPFDLGIPDLGGKRTPEQQFALYKAGKSKCDGFDRKSYHQSGQALDVFVYLDGKVTWEPDVYKVLSGAVFSKAKELGINNLRWGGDWNSNWDFSDEGFRDFVHFELRR